MSHQHKTDFHYASDKEGLIWAYIFTPDSAPKAIDCTGALHWLSLPPESRSNGFVWMHFSLSNVESEPWMRRSLALAEAFYDSLRERVGSTRLELEDDMMIGVIHDVIFNSSFDAANISTASLCMSPRLVVSARLRPLRSMDRLRASVRGGRSLRSSAELLAHLLRDQAEVLGDIVRQSTNQVNAVEDNLLADRISISRSELGTLRRSLVRLLRLLAPEPAALFRLLSRPPEWLSEEDIGELRQSAEEFSATVVDAGALAERLKILQEELAALISERTGRTLFILTVVTVLALPINLVAGLLGMNVGGIPFAQHSQGFLLVVSVLTLVTGILAYFLIVRRKD
jgi:zinc transporter